MKDLIRTLSSLKLVVGVLVLLLVGLACGTIVEAQRGAEFAGRTVYRSWWMFGLLQLLVASTLASLYLHYPWEKRRIGFAVTHAALVVILLGAAISFRYGIDGDLLIWKGEHSSEVVKTDASGKVLRRYKLPFDVKLEAFQIEHYPGTEQPSNYRSELLISIPQKRVFGASIWMNNGFSYGGWDFYQSSYRFEDGKVATVLSASSDSGRPWVFAGYAGLLVGLTIVLATRVAQNREKSGATKSPTVAMGQSRSALALAATVIVAVAFGAVATNRRRVLGAEVERIRSIPLQHDGRVMPFDTLARESVRMITADRFWNHADCVSTVLSWLADKEKARTLPLLKLDSDDVALALGLASGTTHASLKDVTARLPGIANELRADAAMGKPRHLFRMDLGALEQRTYRLQDILGGDIFRVLPGDMQEANWQAPSTVNTDTLLAVALGPKLSGWPPAGTLERELTYNRVQPTRLSWVLLLGALLLAALACLRRETRLYRLALAGHGAGTAVMTWGLITRWQIAGHIPASNMHESLLFLAWGVGVIPLLLLPWMRNRIVLLNATGLSLLTMALNDLLPIDPFIHPMPAVLSGTPWLAIHVPIILLSYSVLALGVVFAHLQLGMSVVAPNRTEAITRVSETLYWYLHVGCLLLTAGIITGSVWAASSWGRYWGWDPKEVWSLVALLAYLAILHGRIERVLLPFGIATFSILAFQSILMTYLGVNFVLSSGMHAYAGGSSPVARWMLLVAAVECAFLLAVYAARRVAVKA